MLRSHFSTGNPKRSQTLRRVGVLLSALLVAALVFGGLSRTLLAADGAVTLEQAAATVQGVVRPAGADLYDVPDGRIVAALEPVSFVTLFGRTADSTWVVASTDDGQTGWVKLSQLIAYNTSRLPVMMGDEVPPAPSGESAPATALPPTATPLPPTPTNTPTSTPSPTPLPPTATPTRAPTRAAALPTRRAASSASRAIEVVGVVGVAGAQLLSAPNGELIQALPVGATISLLGRTQAGDWLQARLSSGVTGWVSATEIVAFNLPGLPVSDATASAATDSSAGATGSATPSPAEESAAGSATPIAAEEAAPALSTANLPTGVVILSGGRLNIREMPSTDGTVLAKAMPGDTLTLLARNESAEWVQVQIPGQAGGSGWVNALYVESSVPLLELPLPGQQAAPVAPRVILPTPTPSPAESSAPAAGTALSAAPAAAARTGLSGNLAIQDGRNNIYIYNLDSGQLRLLTNGFDPAISPDGELVAFNRGGGDDNGIYVINLDGSGERKIWGEGEILRSPKWSPDGKSIVYSRLSGSFKCFDLGFLGCKTFQQLLGEFPFLIIPEVADAFFEDVDRLELPNWGISRVDADGNGAFRDIAALDSAVAPDWNEAGIVYQSAAGINVTEDPEGSTTSSVIAEDWDHDPDWQPDGGAILFMSKEGSHWEIWRVNPDGSGLTALTRPLTTLVDELPSNVAPAWSYDGSRIVYLSSRDAEEDTGPWRLWVMDSGGGNKQLLPINLEFDYAYAAEQVVSWGPPIQ